MNKKKSDNVKNEFKYYLDNMESESIKAYIEGRVIEQINWYNNKCKKNRCLYEILMVASIVISASIPIFTLLLDSSNGIVIKIIISALSSSITGISAVIAFYNYRELWIQYRTNCEVLKSILYRFLNKNGEFSNLGKEIMYDRLVTACESYIIEEFKTWGSIKISQSNFDTIQLNNIKN